MSPLRPGHEQPRLGHSALALPCVPLACWSRVSPVDLGLFLSPGWDFSGSGTPPSAPRYTRALGLDPERAPGTTCPELVGAHSGHYVGAKQGAQTWGSQGSPATGEMGWEPSASMSPGMTGCSEVRVILASLDCTAHPHRPPRLTSRARALSTSGCAMGSLHFEVTMTTICQVGSPALTWAGVNQSEPAPAGRPERGAPRY